MGKTEPKKSGIDPVNDALLLYEGRYGTREMCDIWGTDAHTYLALIEAQVAGLEVLNELYPGNVPEKYVNALRQTANFTHTNPDEIRAEEARRGHDVVAVNNTWGRAADRIEPSASSSINLMRTSADSTETAKAMRCKRSFEVLADSLENLRDIALEKSVEWINDPHMDQTHLYDALPTVAGRPFGFFAEMLQSDLDVLAFFYGNSLVAKWADATGNHHSAVSRGVDGILLQEEYARHLGLRCMTAPAQVPGREYIADIMYVLARTSGTLANLGRYVRGGRGDDSDIFLYDPPRLVKGSSAMPHKDSKKGNPTGEEQAEAFLRVLAGNVNSVLQSVVFDYARDLGGSALDRVTIGPGFKIVDHVTRRMSEVVYHLTLNRARSLDRINRTYGVVTAEQVMTYLVDPRSPSHMTREDAHNLVAELATRAYKDKRPFFDVLAENGEVTSRIDTNTLRRITSPADYIGMSRVIIRKNYDALHGRKTIT